MRAVTVRTDRGTEVTLTQDVEVYALERLGIFVEMAPPASLGVYYGKVPPTLKHPPWMLVCRKPEMAIIATEHAVHRCLYILRVDQKGHLTAIAEGRYNAVLMTAHAGVAVLLRRLYGMCAMTVGAEELLDTAKHPFMDIRLGHMALPANVG